MRRTVTYHILLVDLYYFSSYPYLPTLLGWALEKRSDFIIIYTLCSCFINNKRLHHNNYLTPSITLLMRRFPCLVFRIETPYKLKKRGKVNFLKWCCHSSISSIQNIIIKLTNPVSSFGLRLRVTRWTGSTAEKLCGDTIVVVSLRILRHCTGKQYHIKQQNNKQRHKT